MIENEGDFSFRQFFSPLNTKKAILWIIVIGFIVYANALSGGFVWDDEPQILYNPQIHSLVSSFSSFFRPSEPGIYYKPLMFASFGLIYSVFGANPFWFHLFQICFYIANAILVYKLFCSLFGNSKLSLLFALIFLVHPINVTNAIYSADLQDVLFFFFGSLALLLVIAIEKFSVRSCLGIGLLLLASLLSKETGILFLAISLIYIVLFKKKYLKLGSATSAFVGMIYLGFRLVAGKITFVDHGIVVPIAQLSLFGRLLNTPWILTKFITTFVYPRVLLLNENFTINQLSLPRFFLPLGFLGIVTLMLIIAGIKMRSKTYWFFFIWFLLGMGLHAQIIPLDMSYADHWFYLPEVGLLGMILTVISSRARMTKIFYIILPIIIVFLALRTIIRIGDFKNGLTLYSKEMQTVVSNFDLVDNLGVELFRAGRSDEALKYFEQSIALQSNWSNSWNNAAVIYESRKDYTNAIKYYRRALELRYTPELARNLAILISLHSSPQSAVDSLTSILTKYPHDDSLYYYLALNQIKLGYTKSALVSSQKAFDLNPTDEHRSLYEKLTQGTPIIIKD